MAAGTARRASAAIRASLSVYELSSPMTCSFDASGRPVSFMVASPRSTKCSEFGATGGAAIGIWVIHGCRSSMSRWITAQDRSRDRQPSPSITRCSAPSAAAFHMSWSSSSLLATYRYSAIVVTPSLAATRAMATPSRPSASASRMAAAAMASADSPARGPRLPRSRRPQSRSSPDGSGRRPAVGSVICPPLRSAAPRYAGQTKPIIPNESLLRLLRPQFPPGRRPDGAASLDPPRLPPSPAPHAPGPAPSAASAGALDLTVYDAYYSAYVIHSKCGRPPQGLPRQDGPRRR